MGMFEKFSSLLGRENCKAPDKKPGRNEPCWCGSDVKYKKCHMPADDKKRANAPVNCGAT